MLSRRNLFGVLPAIGVAAVPVAVHATQLAPVQSEAAAFEAAVAALHPALGPLARQASEDGWKPEELWMVNVMSGVLPALLFERRSPEVPSWKKGFEGWMVRTTEHATYQHDREPTSIKRDTARNPNRGAV